MVRLATTLILALAVLGVTKGSAASEHVFRQSGIVLRYPHGWFATNQPVSSVTNPVQRLVLSSYRLPTSAHYSDGFTPSPNGVVAVLVEDLPPYASGSWPARPGRFRPGRFVRVETFGGNRWMEIDFGVHKRAFVLFVGLGAKANPALAKAALNILDGLVIAPHAR